MEREGWENLPEQKAERSAKVTVKEVYPGI
jgi:hypothetical protein